jgi:hypothetical protein
MRQADSCLNSGIGNTSKRVNNCKTFRRLAYVARLVNRKTKRLGAFFEALQKGANTFPSFVGDTQFLFR